MKALIVEKKTDGQTSYNRAKSAQDSVGHKHEVGPDFVGSGYYPPERFVPLLKKFSNPANAAQKTQLLNQLQKHYGNRYVQGVVSAYRSQNVEEAESKLASEIISKKGSGRPLDTEVREFMEPRFEYDFSNVRIHTDSFAAKTAQDLGAEAFTTGKDIFFREGAYSPQPETGRRLLAHELTHVVQQEAVAGTLLSYVSQPGEPLERQAEQVSRAIVEAHSVAKQPGAVGVVARQAAEAAPFLTFAKWLVTDEGWLYNKLRTKLEAAGYKFVSHLRTDRKWEKGFPRADTVAPYVAWSIGSPEGKWSWAATATIVSECQKLVAALPAAKPKAAPKIKLLKDPKAAEKDPGLVADTSEGVAYFKKEFAKSAGLTLKGKRVKVEPGTKFDGAMFITRAALKVYYEWKNTIRACSVAQFERGFELEEFTKEVYKSTKIWIPIAKGEALLVMVMLKPHLALDVVGNLIAGKSIVDEDAMRGYCASTLFAPLGKIKAGAEATKLVKKATDILVDVVKAAGEAAFQQLSKEGKLKPGKFSEDVLKATITSQAGKLIGDLPADSKKLLKEANDKLREVAGGVIAKEAGAAYEAGKEAIK